MFNKLGYQVENVIVVSRTRFTDRYFYIICATLLPVCFSLLWMLKNTQFPTSDANEYLTRAFNIYEAFRNQGIWHGLFHCFFDRGWRPILFPVLTVPILILTHGHIVLSYKILTLIIVLATCAYVYLYLRLFLDQFSAAISANLICLLPFIHNTAFLFMAEAALFPLMIGSLYHLVKSDYFTDLKHIAGFIICLCLALLIRPIEAVTDLAPIFLIYFAIGVYHKHFTIKQVLFVLAEMLVALLIFEFFIFSYYIHHNPFLPYNNTLNDKLMTDFLFNTGMMTVACMFIAIAAALAVEPIRKYFKLHPANQNNNFVKIFSVITVIVLFWFAPFAYRTFSWVYSTSMGDIASIAVQARPTYPVLTVLTQYASEESIVGLLSIAVLACSSLLIVGRNMLLTSPAFLYLFLMLPFPVWEVLNTCQTESRKLSVAVSSLLIGLLIVGLQDGKYLRFRKSLVTGLLALQFIAALTVIYPNLYLEPYKKWFGTYSAPVTISPNPHNIVLKFLDTEAPKYKLQRIQIAETWKYYMPAYPYLLMMMSNIFKHPYQLNYPFYNTFSEDIFSQLSKDNDGIIFISLADKLTIDAKVAAESLNIFKTETLPDIKIFYGLLYYYSANKLKDIGFKQGPCKTFKANDGYLYKSCLLISLLKDK